MENLCIITPASASYQYALTSQARALKQNIVAAGVQGGHFILVTCEKPIPAILEHYRAILGESWQIHHIPLPVKDGNENYKRNAQLTIAQLFTAGFDKARSLGASHVWTVESDVIPEANNLRAMRDMLAFDSGYYDVAFVPYVSQGGGDFMGGRGSRNNWILPGVYDDEYTPTPELQEKIKEHEAKWKPGIEKDADFMAEGKALHDELLKCPLIGNVFARNAKQWRKRGWLSDAYPALGKGSVVPSDWMPMGNNLFSAKAANLMDFMGYSGGGTQDLYACYIRLAPHGVNICVIPHCVSHHVGRQKDEEGNISYNTWFMFHETEGEAIGHLRKRLGPFYSHEPGEEYREPTITDYAI